MPSPLERRRNNVRTGVFVSVTLILAVVMQSLVILVFSAAPKSMWPLIPGALHYQGISITNNILLAMIVS